MKNIQTIFFKKYSKGDNKINFLSNIKDIFIYVLSHYYKKQSSWIDFSSNIKEKYY